MQIDLTNIGRSHTTYTHTDPPEKLDFKPILARG